MNRNHLIDRRAILREWEPALREDFYLAVDSPSGLRWRVTRGGAREGTVAGSINDRGYWRLGCRRKEFQASHVVLVLTGVYPEAHQYEVDHIDRNPGNNNVMNLRWVDVSTNARNRAKHLYAFVNPEGIVFLFNSVIRACGALGLCPSFVRACIAGELDTHQGWTITRIK
jgi:hypothetical protein